jgi:Uma2 family endonuclease
MDTEALLDQLEQAREQSQQMSFEEMALRDESPPITGHSANSRVIAPRKLAQHSVSLPVVTGRHQDVRLFLAVLLKTFVEMTDAGLVREAPFWVKLNSGIPFEPDLLFVSSPNYDRVHETCVEGAPDLIMEVVSTESTAADRGDKFVAYEAGGVREYWLIDPLRELPNLYTLGPDGRYDESRPDTAGRLRSRVLKNFVLDTSSLWRRLLPTTVEIVESVEEMINQR